MSSRARRNLREQERRGRTEPGRPLSKRAQRRIRRREKKMSRGTH